MQIVVDCIDHSSFGKLGARFECKFAHFDFNSTKTQIYMYKLDPKAKVFSLWSRSWPESKHS